MNLKEQLTAKMTDEFNSFRDWMLTQPPEEILNHARDYVIKQDILLNVADADLSPSELETLLNLTSPLNDVFEDIRNMDDEGYVSFLSEKMYTLADGIMASQREAPIYTGTLAEARERGDLDKFKASAVADENCKTAIENAIARNYDGSRLNTNAAIAEVREQYGDKRLVRVTASLISNRPRDGRISPENMKWAEKNATTKKVFTDRTHSGLLDIFATRLRESERKRERGAER